MTSEYSHGHNFEFKAVKNPFYCERCRQLGFGLCYSCECNLFYHNECVNPKRMVKHPFFSECVFNFKSSSPGTVCYCDVCGDHINECHYECCCTLIPRRHAHPHCLINCKPMTLVAYDGLTMVLKKEATGKCLYCGEQKINRYVHGWAYVSPCGDYCYHSGCVMKLIYKAWKSATMKQTRDPFEYIRERFAKDMYNLKEKTEKEDEKKRVKRMNMVFLTIKLIIQALTGNHLGVGVDIVKEIIS